jgi:hypothetical protein
VSAALSGFAVWHSSIHWLVLSVTALTLAPFLDRSPARPAGWSFLAASLALGAWFVANPLWLLEDTSRATLALAVVCALPPIWLAIFDHLAVGIRGVEETESEVDSRLLFLGATERLWRACWATALFVFAAYSMAAALRLRSTGGILLPADSLVLAWAVSAVWHVTMFTLIFLVLTFLNGVTGITGAPRRAHHWSLWAVSVVAIAFVLLRVMLAPIAVRGWPAWLVSTCTAIALASAWSGVGRHWTSGLARRADVPVLDAWFAPIAFPLTSSFWKSADVTGPNRQARFASAAALAAAAVAAQVVVVRISAFDWEFMLQKLITLALWVVAFGLIHSVTMGKKKVRPGWTAPASVIALFAACQLLLPRLPLAAGNPRLNPELVADSYAAVDPSFRVVHDLLGSETPADAAEFYAFLRAHSTIQRQHIDPVDIDFVHRWSGSGDRPPHVFLFIIDSLRPDYLAPYNSAVGFTPAISAFADDSFVFTRAFSRYAGTGLAVPSIWAGSMILHKQYVTPFAPMNALEKLVIAKGYRRFITKDHLTDDLFEDSPDTVALDHDVPEMLHTFCRSTTELGQKLESIALDGGGHDRRPIFALMRPLELHIGNIASARVPAGESYPGFHGPYAARVRRIDTCFGEFLAMLKRTHLYDNSVVVLTSDHGDSLGEGQRWGHGFTTFPEVLRIPLMIHVPDSLRTRFSADLARVSFSTDITPTLYALLGEASAAHGARGTRDLLIGSSLLVDPSQDLSWRRRESYLVASSYGPVYGLISRNGRRLYIADGVESREYAYDLGPAGADARIVLTDGEREAERRAIRGQIEELAAWYRFAPEP